MSDGTDRRVDMARDVLAAVLLVTGSGLALIAAIGLLRFPDVYARMHAATKPATLGLILILAGAMLRLSWGDAATVALVIAFQLLSVPVGSHMIGRAAHRAGVPMSDATVIDELRDAEAAEGRRPRGDEAG